MPRAIQLSLTYLIVHAAYWLSGVRFDDSSLLEFMQFADPEQLRTNLLETLWYLHIQPPVFNLLLGIGLKLDLARAWFFPAMFFAAGFTLYASTYALTLRAGARRWLAYALSTVFMASPAFILWEHFLLYEFLCAALLAVMGVLFFDFVSRGGAWRLAAMFACAVLLCGMRSMFHLGYVALLAALLIAACPAQWRRIALAGGIAFLLVGSVYVKNYVLFGQFTACTFVSKNLWIMTAGNIGWDEKVRLVDEGKLSPLSLVNRWAGLEAYPAQYAAVPERLADIPVLAQPKKANGAVNYNHIGHIAICEVYGRDARYVLVNDPKAYIAALALSTYRYFAPASSPPVSPQNKAAMPAALWFYDHVLLLKLPEAVREAVPFFHRGGVAPHLSLLLGLPALVLTGIAALSRRGWTSRQWLIVFLLSHIALVALLGCALDFHETARYRFLTNAFYVALLGLAVEWLLSRRAAAPAPRRTSPPAAP